MQILTGAASCFSWSSMPPVPPGPWRSAPSFPPAVFTLVGAAIIGGVSSVLVAVVVEGLDMKLHVDDPVGAVAMQCANGAWGALAVGLFSTDGGLFYGGSAHLLGVQALSVAAIARWMTVTSAMGCGAQRGGNGMYRGVPVSMPLRPVVQVTVVVSKIAPEPVVETARQTLQTGNLGDGKIFISDGEEAVKIRIGETGYLALQDKVV